ncbi:MAG: pseudouridine synthase [Oscillospiraceae bacterium]|jgi:16S rRNA pseudouridine516 synthase
MAEQRLDKIISSTGQASRREVKRMVHQGRVTVDGVTAQSAEEKYDPNAVTICVDGEIVRYAAYHYFMLHKPAGVLSATEDCNQKTVLDLLSERDQKLGLFPVGRLDKDTTGLLLLTDDGTFAHRVISPKQHVAKYYYAKLDGCLQESDVQAFGDGLVLADGLQCIPAELRLLGDGSEVQVTVFEGKYHQVKRMIASRGAHVVALHRISIGQLLLDPALKPGNYRALTLYEQEQIFE